MTTISERTYKVLHKTNTIGEITEFIVTDMNSDEMEKENNYDNDIYDWRNKAQQYTNERVRPRVATFPISQLYDQTEQRHRAKMLADYLNKIQEATNKAIRNTNMIDALSINP